MTNSNETSKRRNEMETESEVAGAESSKPTSTRPENESTSADLSQEELTAPANAADAFSPDDVLDDVRRSLIEEETDKHKNDSKWWRRLGRKNKATEPEPPVTNVEIDLPSAQEFTDHAEAQKQDAAVEEYDEQIDDLIDMLEAEQPQSAVEAPPVAAEPEPEIDIEHLKEQAFRPRTAEDEPEKTDVRSIALEGGEEVFVEVQSQAADPFDERLRAFENALKPYRRYLYTALAFLGVVMAVIASLLIVNVYRQSRPQPPIEVSNLPYPTALSLPGGWSFDLARGTLDGGRWEPAGAEWLEGTEVCRWVSLPWSRQLEAVVRTLNPKDPIELVMSNNDKLIYEVYSVYEMSPEEIQQVGDSSPCLLIILTQADAEKRWVLTALP